MTKRTEKIKTISRGGWIRAYQQDLDDPKIQRMPADLRVFWEDLNRFAGERRGILPCTEDIAFRMRRRIEEAEQHLQTLIRSKMLVSLTVDGEQFFEIADWWEKQPKETNSTARVRKHRASKQAVKRNETVSETHETVSETQNETPETSSSLVYSPTDTSVSRGTVRVIAYQGKVVDGSKGTYTRNGNGTGGAA